MTSRHLASLFLFATSSPPADPVRRSLSTHSDKMFFCLVVASAVTGIGVILEAPGELHELRRWWKLQRMGKKVGLKIPIAFFGLLLVIGGIIGEGVFEFLSADAETAIRAHDEQVLGDTIVQAGDAKDSANKARDAADAAILSAETASDTAGDAKKDSSTALEIGRGARKEADSV